MLVDLGFELGYSYRAIPDALALAEGDFKSLSSLLDARLVTGNHQIFSEFQQRFTALLTQERVVAFVEWRLGERERRHRVQAGHSGEPNTKEGRGGLRDFHEVLWILRVTTGGVGLPGLEASGVLTKAECAQCLAVFDFLLRVRNQQHFGFGKCDVLSVDQRRTVAYGLGFPDERRFMERYTHSTRELRHLSSLALRRLLEGGHGHASGRR
jgi:[protein-PII] uridylyltransferase